MSDDQSGGPVGDGEYTVKRGECLVSIAYDRGHLWETIWDDGANDAVKKRRKRHTALLPGDRLHIPKPRRKDVSLDTHKVHRFRRKGIPSKLHIVVRRYGEPRADEPYTLWLDGKLAYEGRTNDDGEVKHDLDPKASTAKLVVGEHYDAETFNLSLGHMDPVEEVSGIQGRLANLGFDCGAADGVVGDHTIAAMQEFQKSQGMEPTEELDDATRQAIEKAYEE